MKAYEEFDLLNSMRNKEESTYVSANGATFVKESGEHVIDMNEMRVVLGQNNEKFKQAVIRAMNDITSLKGKKNYAKERLYQYLDETTGHQFCGVHLTSSGSEAVEAAVRIARNITGKNEILSFWNSIHGRTFLSASLSGVPKRKSAQGELAPGVVYLPYPHCVSCRLEKNECCRTQNCVHETYPCIEMTKIIQWETSAHAPAAIIVEPCQGNGNVIPPKGYLKQLQDWAHENDMLFIVDEIQSGMGRTSSMYCYQEEGLEPDILLLGKALGNGYHLAAVLVKKPPFADVLPALSGGAGEDPICCAAACEVFRQLETGLLEHIKEVGGILCEGLEKIAKHPQIIETRGKGLAAAVEFVDEVTCKSIYYQLEEKGFLTGLVGKTLFFKPPYVIMKEDIEAFLEAFSEIMAEWREKND